MVGDVVGGTHGRGVIVVVAGVAGDNVGIVVERRHYR